MINRKKLVQTAVSGLLMAGLFFTQPAVMPVLAETSAESGEAEGTETSEEDAHMPAYYQEADTNQIEGWPEGPNIEAAAGILMDLNTGTIIYGKNIDTAMYPASITKIMTALLAAEHLDMNESFTMSETAAFGIEAGSSSIYGDAGEVFTVEQAMMGLMLESANEMAIALAEETSGSMKKFVELMNERARELGCTNTHFNNPNGLPDETHYTTAHDMALIARAAYLNPISKQVMSTTYYEIPPTEKYKDTRYLSNHHKMMKGKDFEYSGVIGGKTGYTMAAGNTLVTYAKRDNMTLVAVVLSTISGGWEDTAALLDYGFDNFERAGMKWNKDPSVTLLPSERHIIAEAERDSAFYSLRAATSTIPKGTDIHTLSSNTQLLHPMNGRTLLETKYYFNGYPVGVGIRYERAVIQGLLS